ncbi:MAG: hypothetical protein ACI4TP_04630 [Anaerotignum sp.]
MLFKNGKKVLSLLMVFVLSLALCSCGGTAADGKEPADTTDENEVVSSENIEITEAILADLFKENVDCMVNVFSISHLPYDEETMQDGHICKVSDERFASYADFESYIRSVYCAEEAERLLNHYPYEDSPMYLDVDGELYIDLNQAGAKGYYVDWSNCEITIDSADAEICEFTVKGSIEEPAEVPVKEDYFANGVAVFENGNWVLEKMIY